MEDNRLAFYKAALIYVLFAWVTLLGLIGFCIYRLSVPSTYIAHYTDDVSIPSMDIPKPSLKH